VAKLRKEKKAVQLVKEKEGKEAVTSAIRIVQFGINAIWIAIRLNTVL